MGYLDDEQDLRSIFRHQVLERASSLDTSNHITISFLKTTDSSCLLLQRALDCACEFVRIVEVDSIHVAVCSRDNEKSILQIHGVNTILAWDARNRCSLSHVPIFDGLVPRACNDHGCFGGSGFAESNTADRCIVSGDLLGGSTVCTKIEKLRGFVSAGADYFISILYIVRRVGGRAHRGLPLTSGNQVRGHQNP